MGLRTWLRGIADESSASEETVTYRCQRCDAQFEEAALKMVQIRCPECRSSRVKVTT